MSQKRQFVVVEWNDAWQDQENFTTAHGIAATHEPMPVETMGLLIQDDDTGISIANERSPERDQDTYRGRTFIPRLMVKTVTAYKLVKVAPRKPRQKTGIKGPAPVTGLPGGSSGEPEELEKTFSEDHHVGTINRGVVQ